jgi:hypothetical protein
MRSFCVPIVIAFDRNAILSKEKPRGITINILLLIRSYGTTAAETKSPIYSKSFHPAEKAQENNAL